MSFYPIMFLNWPEFPHKISVDTTRKWLHYLDFNVLDRKKGVYINGHEREGVVIYHKAK